MKIAVIGTGYVGLVQGACLADTGNDVVCMDIDRRKISLLRRGKIPIYEPGLEEVVRRNVKEGRLTFVTSLASAARKSDVIFLCLPTPPSDDGAADVTRVLQVTKRIRGLLNGHKIIVSKSTVPVGTVDRIRQLLRGAAYPVDVVSNPEFLKEGSALQDSMHPDRIVIGSRSPRAVEVLRELYEPFVRTGNPIVAMDERSAEMTKYAANCMLATKISFMNDLANLCDRLGVDIEMVRRGIASDPRIGKQFLFAGVGFGGSCFPKDVKALLKTGESAGYQLRLMRAVDQVNETQKRVLVAKLVEHFRGRVRGRRIAVWGLSFKPLTDDVREAPALVIIQDLLQMGAQVVVHDPVAMTTARKILGRRVKYCRNAYDAVKGADALVVVTEWNEFRRPDFVRLKKLMRHSAIFDGRNIFEPAEMSKMGFVYHGIGRRVEATGGSKE